LSVDKANQCQGKTGKKFDKYEFLKLAEGLVWTGRQANANGLVDELGTLDDAVAAAKVMAGMKKDADVELLVLPKAKNFIDVLMESRSDTRLGEPRYISSRLLTQLGSPFPEIGKHVRSLSG